MSSVSSVTGLSPGTCSPSFCSDPPTPATETEDEADRPSLSDGDGDDDDGDDDDGVDQDQDRNDQYVLVTGGLGFIGSHTSLELLKAGYNIIIVDNLSNSFRDVFNRILLAARLHFDRSGRSSSKSTHCPKAELCCADYRDTSAMNLLLASHSLPARTTDGDQPPRTNISGVIHFAAWKDVAESIQHPLKYYRNNVKGLIDFLTLLADFDIKSFIFSSSASVYGTLAEQTAQSRLREEHCVHEPESYHDPTTDQPTLAEQGCTGITNPYGRSKFFGEAILSDLARADPSWTVVALRYFNPIGCDPSGLLGENPKETPSNLVPVAVRVLTGHSACLCIYGTDWDTPDGTAIRDFIHVSDLARGHIAALAAAREGRIRATFRTFNLGTGRGHSVTEVVRALEEVSGRVIPVRAVGRRAGDVGSCVAVADRAAAELRWTTQRSLRDACQDLWNSLRLETL